jgi:isoamyl acetate esterase
MKTVILIGDSIRLGYQDVVRQKLAGTAEVWGPAENGGGSRNVLRHLDSWALEKTPAVAHLNCGLHDVKQEFGHCFPLSTCHIA